MPDSQWQSLFLMVLAGVILAAAAGLPALLLYRRLGGVPLFPPEQPWAISWKGWAVLLAFVSALILPSIVQISLNQSGFFNAIYGPDFPQKITPEEAKKNPLLKQAANLRGLWGQTVAMPLLLVVIVAGLRLVYGASLASMGLSRRRAAPDLILGYLGWLVLAPLTFAIFMAATALLTLHPDKHPLLDLGPYAGRVEFVVFAVQAAILAPISEELLFRGLLLPWLLQPPAGPSEPEMILPPAHRATVCRLAAAVMSLQTSALIDAWQSGQWQRIVPALAPFFFVLAAGILFGILPSSPRVRGWFQGASPQVVRGCLASSILFAAIHSNVWPSPVPLFVLGVGLGWLAIRTRSIVPPIVVHMLFNGVAVVYLALGGTS